MSGDNWLLPVPAWLSDTTTTATPLCGQPTPFSAVTKPLVSVSDCEFPDVIPRLVCTEAPRDPLAALPQSPVSSSPLLPAPPSLPAPLPKSYHPTTIPISKESLPTCIEGDNCALGRPTSLHSPLDLLAHTSPSHIIRLLGGSAANACAAWRAQRAIAPAHNAVYALLHDTGIRLERRKRLASRETPEHKKAVRAARNRERSQALRRHHKRRLSLLDSATNALNAHCRALRALVHQLVHMHATPDTLERALAQVPGEELRVFLNSEDKLQLE